MAILLALTILYTTFRLLGSATLSLSHVLELRSVVKPDFIVDTGYAKYLGNESNLKVITYLGIPYAEPPLGERRFRRPLPLNKTREALRADSSGIIDATNYPDFCIQGTTGHGDAGGAGSEDCLNVNIYTPPDAKKDSKLPVLFYIHGGGYHSGNPRNWPFDHWIERSPNVIIVSVYYRLSSFGFLSTSAFLGDPSLGDHNAGLLDQIAALTWVKENVASFGGDPRRITINGESAGAGSVELLLVAYGGRSTLFHQAILQSVYRTPVPHPFQQDALFAFYAKEAGCISSDTKSIVNCLRRAEVSALTKAQDAARYKLAGYNVFHPVVDGRVISDYPTKLIQANNFFKVPLIVGATSNETRSENGDVRSSLKAYFPSMQDADINALLLAYPKTASSSFDEWFDTVTGESELRCARTILGTAFDSYRKTWTYRYNEPTPGTPKVDHAAENWMMFNGTAIGTNGTTTFQPQSEVNLAFAHELVAYWLSFVRSGDPNTYKLDRSPYWTQYKPLNERIVLQQPAKGTISKSASGSHLERETAEETRRCQFVASLVSSEEN